jgi:phosphoribosylanthranilate isomerase
MLVKVCGITRLEDARVVVAAGADAVGFVFWPKSPRFVDPYRARAIAAELPPFVTPVGVFVNQTPEYVNGVASLVGLGALQLHGDETPRMLPWFKRPVIKAVSLDPTAMAGEAESAAGDWPQWVMLLVDVKDSVRRGGTGRLADWGAAGRLAAHRRVLLAGGLTPDNVREAIEQVSPFGVDVSSGVERSPGVKDAGRVLAFVGAARRAARARSHS